MGHYLQSQWTYTLSYRLSNGEYTPTNHTRPILHVSQYNYDTDPTSSAASTSTSSSPHPWSNHHRQRPPPPSSALHQHQHHHHATVASRMSILFRRFAIPNCTVFIANVSRRGSHLDATTTAERRRQPGHDSSSYLRERRRRQQQRLRWNAATRLGDTFVLSKSSLSIGRTTRIVDTGASRIDPKEECSDRTIAHSFGV